MLGEQRERAGANAQLPLALFAAALSESCEVWEAVRALFSSVLWTCRPFTEKALTVAGKVRKVLQIFPCRVGAARRALVFHPQPLGLPAVSHGPRPLATRMVWAGLCTYVFISAFALYYFFLSLLAPLNSFIIPS